MNTQQMNANINVFMEKEKTNFLEFVEQARKSILHVLITDACHVALVDVFLPGSTLREDYLLTFFLISKGFNLDDHTRYGQILHRRVIFWCQDNKDDLIKHYGMHREDFLLYDAESLGCLKGKCMTTEAVMTSGLPVMEVIGNIISPNRIARSMLESTPSTSYQLIRYLKTLSPEALMDYVQTVSPFNNE